MFPLSHSVGIAYSITGKQFTMILLAKDNESLLKRFSVGLEGRIVTKFTCFSSFIYDSSLLFFLSVRG